MNQRRVLLADDHPLFREALRSAVVRLRPEFIVEQADSFEAARTALRREPEVELVLLDLKLPDSEGLIGLLSLRAEFPHAPMVVVSATEDATTVSNVIAAGALGFIPKPASMAMMSEALETILCGDVWTPHHLVLAPPSEAVKALVSLSPAQARLLPWVGRGLSNKRIAHELGVTEASVRAHLTAAFRKLGVTGRPQALRLVAAELQTVSTTSA